MKTRAQCRVIQMGLIMGGLAMVALPSLAIAKKRAAVSPSVEYGKRTGDRAKAVLRNAAGDLVGHAEFQEKGDHVQVRLLASRIAPGWHGIHLHTIGACTAPDFKDAGGHWNPFGLHHGQPGSGNAHQGDLPMIWANKKGKIRTKLKLMGYRLTAGAMPILDADGTALVIHEGLDDYRTDPAGNSGARIVCGVLNAKGWRGW